jgi:glycosyltransferase involved in cell wall biosynthesis
VLLAKDQTPKLMKNLPTVSIIIPTYNYACYLEEAIQSVLSQTYQDFELIICDNQSTDNTEELVQKYLCDPRIHYYRNECNLGATRNWNRGIQYAKGKYLKFLCSDDKFHPLLLEQFVHIMEENPDVSLVTSNQEIFGLYNEPFDLPFSGWQEGKKIINESLKTFNWIGGPSSIMLRSCNLALGRFRPDFLYLPDWELWLKHLSAGNCYIIPDRLVYSRIHSNQLTSSINKNYSARFEEYAFYKQIYRDNVYEINRKEIRKMVKKKARACAVVAFKVIPGLLHKDRWPLLRKAVAIAVSENVLLEQLIQVF